MAAPSPPVTIPKLSVARCLLEYLKIEGVDTIFGLPGGALMHILFEMKRLDTTFRFIVARQETGAVFEADGYARATGKLGVALVTAGPGATNALTGTMNAQNSCTSVLTITGEVPETTFGMGYLQEGVDANLNIDAIYRNATQYSAIISSPANCQTIVKQALRDCRSRPPRASHLSLPDDVGGMCMGPVTFPAGPESYRATPRCSDPAAALDTIKQLEAAKRPLLLLGNGTRIALVDTARLSAFTNMVDKFGFAVMTTPQGKGVFPETHPLSLRSYGLAGCTWPALYMLPTTDPAHYDALLVIGSSLQELTTNKWSPILTPAGPFVQVDLDQSVIARAFDVTSGIVAEAATFLDDLIHASASVTPDPAAVQARKDLIAGIKKANSPILNADKYRSDTTPIYPQALMRVIVENLPKDAILFLDGGNCLGWGYHYLAIDAPMQLHSSLDMGTMGFGVGAIVGAKIGQPEKPCVAIVGDGALMMNGAEISTAAEHKAGAIWIVLFDNDLGMVSQGMNQFFPDPTWKHYYHFNKPDLAKFAEALGADGYDIHSPADMAAAFTKALRIAGEQGKPQVIVAHINPDEVPPYYPGAPAAYVPCDQQSP